MSKRLLVAGILAVAFCGAIFAADEGHNVVASTNALPSKRDPLTITTRKGVTYENCRLLRVEPDGISYAHSRGIAKLFFSELPPEYATRYGYNPQAARDYSQTVQERQAQFRQDQENAQQRANQEMGARQDEIRANPKYTVVCRGGKGATVGYGVPAEGVNSGARSMPFELKPIQFDTPQSSDVGLDNSKESGTTIIIPGGASQGEIDAARERALW